MESSLQLSEYCWNIFNTLNHQKVSSANLSMLKNLLTDMNDICRSCNINDMETFFGRGFCEIEITWLFQDSINQFMIDQLSFNHLELIILLLEDSFTLFPENKEYIYRMKVELLKIYLYYQKDFASVYEKRLLHEYPDEKFSIIYTIFNFFYYDIFDFKLINKYYDKAMKTGITNEDDKLLQSEIVLDYKDINKYNPFRN